MPTHFAPAEALERRAVHVHARKLKARGGDRMRERSGLTYNPTTRSWQRRPGVRVQGWEGR